jgi:ABC-type proline/glycine betaine transport system permease subunit
MQVFAKRSHVQIVCPTLLIRTLHTLTVVCVCVCVLVGVLVGVLVYSTERFARICVVINRSCSGGLHSQMVWSMYVPS